MLLTTLQVLPEFAGEGLGRMLVQAVVKDLTRRGVKAIEVFGDAAAAATEPGCLIPADFLPGVGFKTVRPHPRWPRLRLELRTAMTWKEDVEAALEQLLGTITIPMQAAAPVGRRTQPGRIGSQRPAQRALRSPLRAGARTGTGRSDGLSPAALQLAGQHVGEGEGAGGRVVPAEQVQPLDGDQDALGHHVAERRIEQPGAVAGLVR